MNRLELSSLYQLTVTRFKLTLREPEAIFWIFVFPILLALGLGIAFRNRPADVLPVGATTPQLVQALAADMGLRATEMDEAAGTRALATGNILLLAIGNGNSVVYRYDDTNPDARTARMIADRAIQVAAGRRDPVTVNNQLMHETGSRYIDFLVPGLLGMNLMGSAMWGLGFSIVDARAKKLLKRMVASPMPRWQYLAAYLLARLIMLAIEVVVLLGFAWVVFRVPFRGPLAELALICVLSSLTFSALGLLVASRARTMEAVSGLMNVVMMPMWIMSGVFFSLLALSRVSSAVRSGASAHGGHQRHARQHAAGDAAEPHDGAPGDSAGVVCAAIRGFTQDLPLAMKTGRRWGRIASRQLSHRMPHDKPKSFGRAHSLRLLDNGWVGVISVAGAGDQVTLIEPDLDVMVFVGLVGGKRSELDLVPQFCIGEAFFHQAVDIAVSLKCQAATLDGENLQAEIAKFNLRRFGDALKKGQVVVCSFDRFCRSDGTDVVDRKIDLSAAVLRGRRFH